ncbi:MAG: type I secretion protein TolC [Chromatiales bacterium]|nr:type I secretion protein TolC [Chromatiales bacterium]
MTLITIARKNMALGLALFVATAAQGQTLMEIYNQALRSDPALREAEANMLAQLETKPQARAALFPQLDFSAGWQRDKSDGPTQFPDPDGPPGTTVTGVAENETDSRSWSFDLSQTLFNTDQWRRLKKAGKEVAQAQIDFRAAQQDLMIRVSEAYFNVLAAQDTLISEQASKESIGRQLEQAERRFEVGLNAITDVKEAQAAYDDAVALEIEARRSLANSKEALREITGEYPQTLASPGEEFPLIPPNPQVEQDWVDISLQQNLSLESARIGTEISRDNIRIARAGHLPTLDFSASSSNNDRDGDRDLFDDSGILKSTSAQDSESDSTQIRVQLRVPIYSGGGVSSEVQEQVYLHRASRENFEKVARETERETRDAYLGVIAEIARVQALARSEESNMIALEATEAGYEVGTRTAVDVLDARRSLFLAQTQYARAKYDYLINVIKLKDAAGTLSADDIGELDSWLVTKEQLQAIPGRGGQPDASLPDTTATEPASSETESAE